MVINSSVGSKLRTQHNLKIGYNQERGVTTQKMRKLCAQKSMGWQAQVQIWVLGAYQFLAILVLALASSSSNGLKLNNSWERAPSGRYRGPYINQSPMTMGFQVKKLHASLDDVKIILEIDIVCCLVGLLHIDAQGYEFKPHALKFYFCHSAIIFEVFYFKMLLDGFLNFFP